MVFYLCKIYQLIRSILQEIPISSADQLHLNSNIFQFRMYNCLVGLASVKDKGQMFKFIFIIFIKSLKDPQECSKYRIKGYFLIFKTKHSLIRMTIIDETESFNFRKMSKVDYGITNNFCKIVVRFHFKLYKMVIITEFGIKSIMNFS